MNRHETELDRVRLPQGFGRMRVDSPLPGQVRFLLEKENKQVLAIALDAVSLRSLLGWDVLHDHNPADTLAEILELEALWALS